MSNEALAALGLTDEVVSPEVNNDAAAVADKAEREEVEVGEIEVGTINYIPASTRSAGGSKYKFAELAAPKTLDDGRVAYSHFTVRLQPGVDETKLKRSVQSATTQENKKNKDRNDPAYYITRTVNQGGKFVAIMVIRTDAPRADDSDAE